MHLKDVPGRFYEDKLTIVQSRGDEIKALMTKH